MNTLKYIPDILSYGLIGFAFLLSFLTYRLLKAEQKKDQPHEALLKSINKYILFCVFLAFGGLISEVLGPAVELWIGTESEISTGAGVALGRQAHQSFVNGGDATQLDGRWRATWYTLDDSAKRKQWEYFDDELGEMKTYPPDVIIVKTHDSVVSCTSINSRFQNLPYWLEGRVSNKDYLTLMYWSPLELRGGNLVGIVILRLRERRDKKLIMEGLWQGYTGEDEDGVGVVTYGETEWLKLD